MAKVEINLQAIVDDAIANLEKVDRTQNELETSALKYKLALENLDRALEDLNTNTNPEKQTQLQLAVSKAEDAMLSNAEAVKKLSTNSADLAENTEKTKLSLTDLKSGLELAKDAARMVGEAYQATVGVFLEYAEAVRDVTTSTGIQADEASRLIESSDDAGVSVGVLKLAMKTMLKDGVQPSIESMAALSDEYLAIEDPAQRAQFAMDKFGRSGLEMIKWLEKGGDAMRDTAAVMDDEMAASAENARMAMDALDDATRNAALSIGARLAPAVTTIVVELEKLITLQDRLKTSYEQNSKANLFNAKTYEEYAKEERRLTMMRGDTTLQTLKLLTEEEWMYARAAEASRVVTEEKTATEGLATARTVELKDAVVKYTGSIYEKMDAENNAAATAQLAIDRLKQQKIDQDNLTEATSNYQVGLAGLVGKEQEDYLTKTTAIKEENIKLQGEIDTLNAKPYLTAAQREQLIELKLKLKENTQTVEDNAKAHEEATRKITLGYLEQNFALGGTTYEETVALMKVAEAFGAIDKGSVLAFENARTAVENFNTSGDMQQLEDDAWAIVGGMDGITGAVGRAADSVGALQTRISQLQDKDVYIRVHYQRFGSENFGGAGDPNATGYYAGYGDEGLDSGQNMGEAGAMP